VTTKNQPKILFFFSLNLSLAIGWFLLSWSLPVSQAANVNVSACVSSAEVCNNAVDDDCDNLIDCNDSSDCSASFYCTLAEDCTNGIDDDFDTNIDCADDDCSNHPSCGSDGPPADPICGNGIEEQGEECDNGAQNSNVTPNACRTTCRFYDCGDHVVDSGEECDDGNVSGGDGCSAICEEEICGDDVLDTGEQCDNGAQNSNVTPNACRTNCLSAHCSDNVLDTGEQCEDGNLVSGDGCDSNCTPTACGNGIRTTGESCDDGNLINGDGCSAICILEECGNGALNPGESCDDGNILSGDGCSSVCQSEGCGNNQVDPGESCDDGNLVGGDGCSAVCRLEEGCGDGGLDPGESCDDGNLINGDGCDSNCTQTACGNSLVSSGEQCDDGNLVSGDGCSAVCAFEQCGNGVLNPGESCDDGNINVSDSCDTQGQAPNTNGPCTLTFCGDGLPQTVNNEQCDDGNNAAGDGCSVTCQLESICGNGVVNAGEQCDPPGFGCSVTCQIQLVIIFHEVPNNLITTTSAVVNWQTNLASTAVLEWEKASGGGEGLVDNLSGTNYNYTITGLEPGVRYNYTITASRAQLPFDQHSVSGTFLILFEESCGDGICSGSETPVSCPVDCVEECNPNWTCTSFGECVNGVRVRECTKLNPACLLDIGRPPVVTDVGCGGICNIACDACAPNIDFNTCSCIPQIPCCGNRICEFDLNENTASCPTDCGLLPTLRLALTACLDGLDNDGDGLIDYPADPACSKPTDDSELNFAEVLENLQEFLANQILNNPLVEQVNQTLAAPTLVALTVINTFATFSFFNFLSYLQYFFTQPFAALFRRKRKKWGVTYNSITKQPVDLAIVRLYKKGTGQLVQSRVTDRQGRYTFIVEPGEYYLTVTKPKFDFPSSLLKAKIEDGKFLDLYHGENITVTDRNVVITANIPLDPKDDNTPARQVVLQYYLRKIQYAISFSAVPLAAVSMVISPGALTFSLFGFHCLLYVLFRRLGYQKPPKSWGIIYDKTNNKSLPHAITRIYDKQYNKLLETRLTDAKGRYAFLVDNNVYFLTADKTGYKTSKSQDINLVTKGKETVVDLNIGLEKGQAEAATVQPTASAPEAIAVTPPPGKVGLPAALSVQPLEPQLTEKSALTARPSLEDLARKVSDVEVSRQSLEELLKTKKSLSDLKEDLGEQIDQLENLEEKVETITEQVTEKIEQKESESQPAPVPPPTFSPTEVQPPASPTQKPAATPPASSQGQEQTSSAAESTTTPPTPPKPNNPPPEKSIFG